MKGRKNVSHHWIAGSFIIVGAMLAHLAREHGGVFLILLWPAFNCVAVGGAYYGPAGRVFGKRADGAMNPFFSSLMLPFLAVLRMTWNMQIAISAQEAYSEVGPGLWVGRRARRGEYPPEADCVIDMTSEFAKPAYHPKNADYLCVPTLDAYIPEDEEFSEAVLAVKDQKVFVHCANGHGRSATFAAALLLARGQADSIDDALAKILKARPLCALNPAQYALLERFAN